MNEIYDEDGKIKDGPCHCCGEQTDSWAGNPSKWAVAMWDGIEGSGHMARYCMGCQSKMIQLWHDVKDLARINFK